MNKSCKRSVRPFGSHSCQSCSMGSSHSTSRLIMARRRGSAQVQRVARNAGSGGIKVTPLWRWEVCLPRVTVSNYQTKTGLSPALLVLFSLVVFIQYWRSISQRCTPSCTIVSKHGGMDSTAAKRYEQSMAATTYSVGVSIIQYTMEPDRRQSGESMSRFPRLSETPNISQASFSTTLTSQI